MKTQVKTYAIETSVQAYVLADRQHLSYRHEGYNLGAVSAPSAPPSHLMHAMWRHRGSEGDCDGSSIMKKCLEKLSALDRIGMMSNNLLSECRYLIDQSWMLTPSARTLYCAHCEIRQDMLFALHVLKSYLRNWFIFEALRTEPGAGWRTSMNQSGFGNISLIPIRKPPTRESEDCRRDS